MPTVLGIVSAALLATLFIALTPGQAVAEHVQCGDVITEDTTLDSDLIDCPGDGLVIGAPGVRLELDGHTIDGNDSRRVCEYDEESGTVVGGPGCFFDPSDDFGVDNGAGHDDVMIANGTVKSFGGAAVRLGNWVGADEGATGNRVRRLTAVDSNYGILVANSDGNWIEDNTASANRLSGISLSDSSRNEIDGNRLTGNGSGVGLASTIDGRGSLGNQLRGNRASGNAGYGIGLHPRAGENVVVGNVLKDNRYAIWSNGNRNNRITHNRAVQNRVGIVVDYCRDTLVKGNAVVDRGGDGEGIRISSGGDNVVEYNVTSGGWHGINLYDTESNEVRRNRTSRNREDGVAVIASHGNEITGNFAARNGLNGIGMGIRFNGLSHGNRVVGNRLLRNRADGIVIGQRSTGNVIERNVAERNGDDGIDVDDPVTTLSRNWSGWNLDFGIEAVPGVTDGGGNHARRNGNPAQCLNVSC